MCFMEEAPLPSAKVHIHECKNQNYNVEQYDQDKVFIVPDQLDEEMVAVDKENDNEIVQVDTKTEESRRKEKSTSTYLETDVELFELWNDILKESDENDFIVLGYPDDHNLNPTHVDMYQKCTSP
eukprot:TRINITY_DN610_c0_g1_i3.p2 TRINITY_DN610_c0_g1~~TRINITY_DN610_c0_g1_i3.p2  ORF type:complete len:125 (-),score=28.40 TRINITY_DN610_c0_g1_i3:217-591(-)